MISSGRCHGPGCTREAKTAFWCSAECQEQWDRQVAGIPAPVIAARLRETSFDGQPLVAEWTVRVAINGHLSEDSARTFADSADRAAEMVREVMAEPHPEANPDPTRGWLARVLDRLFGRTT